MKNSRVLTLLGAVTIVTLALFLRESKAQFFDPHMDDKVYMDSIQTEVMDEVKETKEELLEQAQIIQHVTKNYIAARIKHNFFKALRVLAEKELQIDAMTMADRPRQPRQEDEDGGSGDEETEVATTRKPSNVIPQVASLIKAVFGGNINLTSYVESAATFLPKPIGTQLVGVVKLLANNPGYKYTSTTPVPTTPAETSATPKVPLRGPGSLQGTDQTPVAGQGQSQLSPTGNNPSPPKPPGGQEEYRPLPTRRTSTEPTDPAELTEAPEPTEEEEEEFSKRQEQLKKKGQRQLNLPGLDLLGNLGNRITGIFGNEKNKANTNAQQSSNKTTSGFDEEPSSSSNSNNKMSGIDVGSLAKEFRMGLGDLIKVMPDIFRGAHEAYKLLSSVSQLFSRLENEP